MASIRRTLSTAANCHDRPTQTQRLSSSPLFSSSPFSPFRRILISVMGLLFLHKPSTSRNWKWASHHHQHHQQWNWKWKKSCLRLFLFFFLGFLLGFSPFAHLHGADLKPHHFFFDSIATTSTRSNPHRNLGAVVDLQKANNNRRERERENNAADSDLLPVPDSPPPKLLIVVTPTYNRALQAYYLSRLGQTLRLVPPPLLWIVVEMKSVSMETSDILRTAGVTYRHLVCDHNSTSIKDRGVHQRNTALDHIQRHLLDGIVYFADDDNIYSLHLFHHLRNIRRFGTWPVAMLAQSKNKATLEGPVCNGTQVIGWHTNEKSKRLRRFHVDMSGFAFNSTILWDPKRWRRPTSDAIRQLDTVKEGFQETTFIEQVVEDESQMVGVPHYCSKIMNWHLHLEARHLFYPKGWQVSRNL